MVKSRTPSANGCPELTPPINRASMAVTLGKARAICELAFDRWLNLRMDDDAERLAKALDQMGIAIEVIGDYLDQLAMALEDEPSACEDDHH